MNRNGDAFGGDDAVLLMLDGVLDDAFEAVDAVLLITKVWMRRQLHALGGVGGASSTPTVT